MFTEYCPSCRQKKANCKCKRVASIQQEKIERLELQPFEGEDGQLFFIAQRRPWQQRQGMPSDPLNCNSPFPAPN